MTNLQETMMLDMQPVSKAAYMRAKKQAYPGLVNKHGFAVPHDDKPEWITNVYLEVKGEHYVGVILFPVSDLVAEKFQTMTISAKRNITRVLCTKVWDVAA